MPLPKRSHFKLHHNRLCVSEARVWCSYLVLCSCSFRETLGLPFILGSYAAKVSESI